MVANYSYSMSKDMDMDDAVSMMNFMLDTLAMTGTSAKVRIVNAKDDNVLFSKTVTAYIRE